MKEISEIEIYTWLLGFLLYGMCDSAIILSRWIAGDHTYYIPLIDFGIVGLFALKGLVLLTAVLLFPLCHSMSSPYAQYVPFVFSAIVVSVGLHIVVQNLLLAPPLGFLP